ncbi:hypothetical protein GCM10023403_10170 [Pseudonocardia benzenivorans]|uniref:helix-turn-helix domain-containing protein n=1 Tax=Pseudonocardia benzenivorans TaxID=228005 RepID=UPI0031F7E3A2
MSSGDVAAMLAVPVDTVRRWADEKLLPTFQPAAGKHRRFRRADVEAFIRKSSQEAS